MVCKPAIAGACRTLTSETVDNTRRLKQAFVALRARPVLFQYSRWPRGRADAHRPLIAPFPVSSRRRYSLNELAAARRNGRVRAFVDALTHGGPGGNPPPIEMHSHDPLRYARCLRPGST